MPEQYYLYCTYLLRVCLSVLLRYICQSIFFVWIWQSFIPQAVLQQVHSLFQSEFFTECELVLPVSNFSILSFLKVI